MTILIIIAAFLIGIFIGTIIWHLMGPQIPPPHAKPINPKKFVSERPDDDMGHFGGTK
jgi:hypothetical protein